MNKDKVTRRMTVKMRLWAQNSFLCDLEMCLLDPEIFEIRGYWAEFNDCLC